MNSVNSEFIYSCKVYSTCAEPSSDDLPVGRPVQTAWGVKAFSEWSVQNLSCGGVPFAL